MKAAIEARRPGKGIIRKGQPRWKHSRSTSSRGMTAERSDGERPPSDALLRILDTINRIPIGRVCTYGRIAAAAGLPGRARMVGRILRDSPLACEVCWHRVVSASGRISERPGNGAVEQAERLLAEGVEVGTGRSIHLEAYLWEPGTSAVSSIRR